MRLWAIILGLVILFFALAFIAVPYGAICGVPLLIIALVLVPVGVFTTEEKPAPPPQPVYWVQQPVYYPAPQPPPQPQVIREKEVVTREVIKVRCRNCGALADAGVNNCPSCGAPMR